MTKYAVEVYEVYRKIVPIEADSEEEAEDKAEWLWNQDMIEFEYDASEFTNPEFICGGEYEE